MLEQFIVIGTTSVMGKKQSIRESKNPLRRFWLALTQPPYMALPWVVFLYATLSCLVYIDNGPFTRHIVGFDDQVRMVQVLQWVNGGGWYDRLITRVNAPEGFQSIWARIVDIPIAAVIVVTQLFVQQKTAALIASVIVPMAELALMFLAARYYARPIAGKKEARLVVLFLMFTTVLNHKTFTLAGFHLGEASHHAWYGILNVVMYGAVARIVLGVPGYAARGILGWAIALLLAVGIEGFPMIAGMAALLALIAWGFQRAPVARRGAEAFGVGALLNFLLLPMHVPPGQWFDISFTQPSFMGPLLLSVASLFLLLEEMLLRMIVQRFATAVLLGLLATGFAAALILVFPDLLAGGTAGLSPNERQLAASEHPEIWSMLKVSLGMTDYICLVMPSLIALATAFAAMAKARNTRRRMMYGAYAGFVLVPSALAQIYWRYIHHAQTAVCPLLLHAWQKIRARLPKKKMAYASLSLLAFVALGPFWMLFLPAFSTDAPFLTQVAFFPAKIYTEPYSCDPLSIADYINRHYSPQALLNVPDWDSASFLYETDLRVDFLSNYPSHDHFIDNRYFFQTQDMNLARQIALKHGFNLVAACTLIPMTAETAASRPYREPSLIERLKEGSQPAWLKPVPTGVKTYYNLFEVDRAALLRGS